MWEEANLTERRKLLLAMLKAVYVDTVEAKAIVAILPKPAFRPLIEIASTREGSDVILINEPPEASNEPEAADSCFWWRRGRVDLYLKHGLAVLVAIRSASTFVKAATLADSSVALSPVPTGPNA